MSRIFFKIYIKGDIIGNNGWVLGFGDGLCLIFTARPAADGTRDAEIAEEAIFSFVPPAPGQTKTLSHSVAQDRLVDRHLDA